MSNPRPAGAGMGPEWGAESEIPGSGDLIAGTQVPEDAPMDLDVDDGNALERLCSLLANTRAQLARAVEEANEMQAWSSDEEPTGNKPGQSRLEDLSEEALAKMSAKEREAAIKRARNREAARRSRQRKNERIAGLYRDIKTLQQENLLLLKSIEQFTQKAIACKEQQMEMKEQLAGLASNTSGPLAEPMATEEPPAAVAGPSSERRPSPVGGLALPSLEELQRLRGTEPAQLTARSGSQSARGSAVAEHMAMLSKDNSPRDDEAVPGAGAAAAAAPAVAGVTAAPAPAPGAQQLLLGSGAAPETSKPPS